VASRAVSDGVSTFQWIHTPVVEIRLDVRAAYGLPTTCRMALGAGRLHPAIVRIGMAVSADGELQTTIRATFAALAGPCPGTVTVIARGGAMESGERILSLLMIERVHRRTPVRLIVAIRARLRIEPSIMRIFREVASGACRAQTQICPIERPVSALEYANLSIAYARRIVAVRAPQGVMAFFQLVPGLRMVEFIRLPADQFVIRTHVVKVAGGTVFVTGPAMKSLVSRDPARQGLMASQASVRGDSTGPQFVTLCAVANALELGVN